MSGSRRVCTVRSTDKVLGKGWQETGGLRLWVAISGWRGHSVDELRPALVQGTLSRGWRGQQPGHRI